MCVEISWCRGISGDRAGAEGSNAIVGVRSKEPGKNLVSKADDAATLTRHRFCDSVVCITCMQTIYQVGGGL